MQVLAIAVLALGALYWGAQLLILIRVALRVPQLHRLPAPERDTWPTLSVILTACNEEESLERALQDRLADDYPELEIILVEDRSTDATPAIADRMAEADPRLKVVHIEELPEGWLGKLNALQQGQERASSEWLLFSDADVSVHRGALRRVIEHCERSGLDHCAVMPRLRRVNLLLDSMSSFFTRLVALNLHLWAIEDPRSSASVGVGAFNLVRRAALQQSPGFEWLRMEVADDISLGQMLKACGARQSALHGGELVDLVFHASVGDAMRSAERASYTAIGNFSLPRLAGMALVLLLLELTPLCALLLAQRPVEWVATAGIWVLAVSAMVLANLFNGRGLVDLLLFPVAAALSSFSTLRSGIVGTLRGGITWRGTHYSNAQLKAGRRFGTAWQELGSWRERAG